jgi:uncharacterized caspase-like protein
MPRIRKLVAALVALLALAFAAVPAQAEKRIALVIGNAGYAAGALNTPANDAGLIAQTLQAAGFDVVGARDLDQDTLRHAFRDFLEKASGSGPDTVAFIYLSGYGTQLEGENYFVPIDARIARDSDVAAQALRISDYTRPLAAMKLKASIVVLDAARANPFASSGPALAGGLALVEPEPGVLIAFNSAPGTVAPETQGPYGPYAQALAEMIREGGLPLTDVFERTRLRVNEISKGAEVPWHASKIAASLVFFERAADAPPPAISSEQSAAIRARPIRDLDAQEAYVAALERDTLEGYSDFLAAYPSDPMARRVRAIIAARREAITWRRTRLVDTPPAYWSYLRRYPDGPHAGDAHRRLAFLAAAFEPPPSFAVMAYDDLPPPPPEEIIYFQRPVLAFDDPVFGFAPPPPVPVIFLAPPPPEFVVLAPPPPPGGIFLLPMPIYRPVPVWVRPPQYVAPPPNNVIYNNVHNTVVVNNVTNTVTVTNQSGQTTTIAPPAQAAAPAQGGAAGAPVAPTPAAAIAPALPPSVAQKAVTLQNQTPQGTATTPSGPAQTTKQVPGQPGQPLPGLKGQPLPAPPAAPSAAIAPGTGASSPTGAAKPGTPSPQIPATKPVAPTTPSAAVTPGTQAPTAPSGGHALPIPPAGQGAKPGTPLRAPAAKLAPPSTATKPVTPSAPARSSAQPGAQTPTAKLPASSTPAKPITPSSPSIASPSLAKPASPPQVPSARSAPPQVPPAFAKPAAPPASPPPAAMVKPVAPPPPPPPAAKVVAPPPPAPPPAPKPVAPAPAAAAAKPAAAPAPKGCPPGKAAAVVNGQPVCK